MHDYWNLTVVAYMEHVLKYGVVKLLASRGN